MDDSKARSSPSCSQETNSNPEENFLPGFKDVNNFNQKTLRSALQATRASNDLPTMGDDYDYYTSYQEFRDLMDIEGKRILHIIQDILKHQNVRGNLTEDTAALDVEDKYDVLIDCNDQILERVGSQLDEAAGIKKTENKLVIASMTPQQVSSASWNKRSLSSSKSPGNYRLLAARGTHRPQTRFKDKIDNRNLPFIPIIKHKPNAQLSLEDSLRLPATVTSEDIEQPDFMYPHPYQFELDNLKPSPSQINTEVETKGPESVEKSSVIIVDKVADLDNMCKVLSSCKEIAVDLEHHSYRSFQGITCLMQISTRQQDYIIDTLELRSELHKLNQAFTDPDIVKVLHGADMDVCWLQRDFGVYIVNLFDTGQASRVLGLSSYSLAHLLQIYCQVTADKQYQLADWRIRPLPAELIKYAREDTHYLLFIYDKMKNELIENGNEQKNLLMSVLQRSTAVGSLIYKKQIFKEYQFMELYAKSKKAFNSQQLLAMKNLFAWRNRVARAEDESVGYVAPNHMLIQIADLLPRETQGVLACCNPIPPMIRQCLMEIHAIVMEARDTPVVKIGKPKIQPSAQQHPKYDADSLLNCPHDLSHQDQHALQVSKTDYDVSLNLNDTGDFGAFISLKTKSLLTAFDWHKEEKELTTSQKKAAEIKACFLSPYANYLPSADVGPPISLANSKRILKNEDSLTIKSTWKLMKNTVKRKEVEETKPVPETEVQPPKRAKVEVRLADNSEKMHSLREQRNDAANFKQRPKKKKKEKHMAPHGQAADSSLNNDSKVTFQPFDYNRADKSMFQGGSSSKKKKPNKGPRGNKVGKPKIRPSGGKKSHTFGKNSNRGARHDNPKH